MNTKLEPMSEEKQKKLNEEADRYTQPTDEAIIEYSKQRLEKMLKRAKEKREKQNQTAE